MIGHDATTMGTVNSTESLAPISDDNVTMASLDVLTLLGGVVAEPLNLP